MKIVFAGDPGRRRRSSLGRRLLVAVLARTRGLDVAARCRVSEAAVSKWSSGQSKPAAAHRELLEASYRIPITAWDDHEPKTPKSAPAPAGETQMQNAYQRARAALEEAAKGTGPEAAKARRALAALKPRAASKVDVVAQAAQLLGVSRSEALAELERRAGPAAVRPAATDDNAAFWAAADQRLGLIRHESGTLSRVTAPGGTAREYGVPKVDRSLAVAASKRVTENARTPLEAPPESAAAAADRRGRMNAAFGLHQGGVRKEGNALVFGLPTDLEPPR